MNDELINEKFTGLGKLINAHFENVTKSLETIEKQTTKTNNRVTHLEEDKVLFEKEIQHYIDTRAVECPIIPRVKKLEDDLVDANFFFRHPKLFIAILVAIVILTLGTFIENNPLKIFSKEPVKTEATK